MLYRYQKYEEKAKNTFFPERLPFRRIARTNVCSMISGGGEERKKCMNKHGRREKEPLLLARHEILSKPVPADGCRGDFPPACMETAFHAPFEALESFVLLFFGGKEDFFDKQRRGFSFYAKVECFTSF